MDEAVSVRAIERRLGDHILENAAVLMPSAGVGNRQENSRGRLGARRARGGFLSEPAGHEVRVFEKMPVAGGMLAYGIPAYRLPKEKVAGSSRPTRPWA